MKKTIPASECFVIRFSAKHPKGGLQVLGVFQGHVCVAVVHEDFGAEGSDALIAKFGPMGANLRMFEEVMGVTPRQLTDMSVNLAGVEIDFT